MILVIKQCRADKIFPATRNVFESEHGIPNNCPDRDSRIENFLKSYTERMNIESMRDYQKDYDLWKYLVLGENGKDYGRGIMNRVLKVYGPDHYMTKIAWNSYDNFRSRHPEPNKSTYEYSVTLDNIIN